MKFKILTIVFCLSLNCQGQSFSDEKVSAINFIKRVYNASPFEGAKKLEGENETYFAVVVTDHNNNNDAQAAKAAMIAKKAQQAAEQGFAEPCLRFEMIGTIERNSESGTAYLFLCETLSQFVSVILKKKPFEGARIISSPIYDYLVAVTLLDKSKYASATSRDKVASMKAKQQANTLLNGSSITSETIIQTEENASAVSVTQTDLIRENAMGFVSGIEILNSFEITGNQTAYVFYKSIAKTKEQR
jgi:hypothetical protein